MERISLLYSKGTHCTRIVDHRKADAGIDDMSGARGSWLTSGARKDPKTMS